MGKSGVKNVIFIYIAGCFSAFSGGSEKANIYSFQDKLGP